MNVRVMKDCGVLDAISDRVKNELNQGNSISTVKNRTEWFEAKVDEQAAKKALKAMLEPDEEMPVCPFG